MADVCDGIMLNGGLSSKVIEFLPTLEEKDWLVNTLIAVRKNYGVEAFLASIVVEPDGVYFPDPWRGGQASIERLARRVLHFAGISKIPTTVHIVEEKSRSDSADRKAPWGNFAGWVEKDREGKFGLFIHERIVKDPVVLVAVLARGVAHIYGLYLGNHRSQHQHRHRHTQLKPSWHPLSLSEPSDPRIDVIAAYLGFSIIIIQGQSRMRQSARGSSQNELSSFVSARLPNVAIAYLLSIQLKIRGLDNRAIAQVAKRLAPNDAACLNSATRELDEKIFDISQALELPSAEAWPETRKRSDYVADLADNGENGDLGNSGDDRDGLGPLRSEQISLSERPLVQEDRGIVGANAGKPVFRVRRRMLGRMVKVAVGLGFLIGMVSRGFPGLELDAASYGISFVALILVAGLFGIVFNESRCSDPKCEQKLLPDMRECPRCQGQIVGEIRHANQRLAAEENYLQSKNPNEIIEE